MLKRLLVGLVAVLLVAAVALTLPLARMVADSSTQVVYTDRLADAHRFAALAGPALAEDRTEDLADELHQYTAVYGVRTWLLLVDRSTRVSGDGTPAPDGVRNAAAVVGALAGNEPQPPAAVTPGSSGDLLVAVPVGAGADAIAAVVTLSPLGRLRHEIAWRWALLALVAMVVTGLLLAAAVPFSRWLLRPVARLDAAVGEIAAGRLESRVALDAGPPELRRLAGSFDRMAAVVERTLQRQQQFVGDASHQLRTPLTSLRLSLENLGALLPRDPDDPARAEHGEAVEEALAMGRMLDGLLALTRLGSEPAVVESVDEVVDHAVVGWRARCTAAGIALALDVEPGLRVVAPPGGLRHLLDELVENCCRLSGGTRAAVTARRHPDAVEVTVRDDGVGLDDDGRAAATRRFWRATGQQNTAGSGLGLAIVAELVETAGGTVALQDAAPGLAVSLRLRPAPSGFVLPEPGDGGGVEADRPGGDRGADVDPAAVGVGPEAA